MLGGPEPRHGGTDVDRGLCLPELLHLGHPLSPGRPGDADHWVYSGTAHGTAVPPPVDWGIGPDSHHGDGGPVLLLPRDRRLHLGDGHRSVHAPRILRRADSLGADRRGATVFLS